MRPAERTGVVRRSARPAGRSAAVPPRGSAWTVNGVTYTVDWVTLAHGYGADPTPQVEVSIAVDNRGKDQTYYPDPAVSYDGVGVAVAGWTQPVSGAQVAPGHSGVFRSAFPLSTLATPGGSLQIRVMAYSGDVQELGYWAGPV